jgi:hypothetical protein
MERHFQRAIVHAYGHLKSCTTEDRNQILLGWFPHCRTPSSAERFRASVSSAVSSTKGNLYLPFENQLLVEPPKSRLDGLPNQHLADLEGVFGTLLTGPGQTVSCSDGNSLCN